MWVPGQEATRPAEPERVISLPVENTSAVIAPARTKDNFIAAMAYFTFIPAIFFLLVDPFKQNRFVRFHSFQSIFLAGATIVVAVALRVLYSALALIPGLGYLLAWLSLAVASLGWVILWLVLIVKALQGQAFKLPWIGSPAEKA